MVTPGGILTETPAILAFIAQSYPAARLAPLDDPFAFAEMQAFNSYLCSTVHVAHAHRMRGTRWADDQDSFDDMKRKVPQTVTACYHLIESRMLKGPWVLGEAYTVAMAVASMKCGFLPMTQTAINCFPVAYHDYEGPAVDVAERERLVDHLGSANYLVLRNHGLLVCNKTAAGAFRSIHQFEAACQAQVDAMAGGEMPLVVPQEIVARSVERRRVAMAKRPTVELHWPAMLRLLDRRDPGWRD
jgi:glutathione S-transferase